MRHPSEGTLRRLLDEPAGVADADRDHVTGCPICLADVAAAQRDAEFVAAALHLDGAVPEVDAAWRRLAAAGPRPRRAPGMVPRRRWSERLSSPVVAVVGALALVTGAGAAAAGDWFEIFRTERIAAVELSEADLVALPDLSAYGEFEVTQRPELREVASAAAAAAVTGFPAPRVAQLPNGVVGDPTYRVGNRMTAVFRYSAEKAAQTAAALGEELPPPPPGLDGSRFRLVAGPGVAAVWSSRAGFPALLVARATAPTASSSSGVDFETARDYLLSLPGMPADLAAQLRSFGGDASTLPLPISAEQMRSRTDEVAGAPATVLTSRDGALAGVVWVRDGAVTAVAGSLSTDEVLTVGRELRPR